MKPMRSKAERYAMALVFAGITAVWGGIVWTTAVQLIARYAVERCPPAGIASSKTEPSDSDLTDLNLAPDPATKVEEMASPNPIPSGFVVKTGSNMRTRSSAEIPGPESWTDINTVD